MNKRLVFIVTALFFSCGEESPHPEPSQDLGVATDTETAKKCDSQWVCWSPNTPHHGQECSSECLEPGNNNKYCYLVSECEER